MAYHRERAGTKMNVTEIAARFEPTTVGINVLDGETNLIDYTTGVQIWSGWNYSEGQIHRNGFWVGVPATVRNSGVKALAYGNTLDEAYTIAAELGIKAAAKMARLHREALKLNAA